MTGRRKGASDVTGSKEETSADGGGAGSKSIGDGCSVEGVSSSGGRREMRGSSGRDEQRGGGTVGVWNFWLVAEVTDGGSE